MDTQAKAKKAAILKMMYVFPSSQDRINEKVIDAYVEAVAEVSADAVERACKNFTTGRIDRNNAFMPSGAELAANARQWDEAIAAVTSDREVGRIVSYRIGEKPPPGFMPLGEWEDRRNRLAVEAREGKHIPIKIQKMDDRK